MPFLSIFENCKATTPRPEPIALEGVVDLVCSPELREKIEPIRALDPLGDEEIIKALKESLPCITPSGIAVGRGEKGLKHYSAVVCLDLDDLENPEEIRQKLQSDPNVLAFYLSPSGKGFKVFVLVNTERKWHKMAYRALSDYFKEKIGVGADFKAADISHLCFLSYDPDAYYNPNAETFQVPEAYLVESPEVSLPVEGQQQVCTELDTPEQEAAAVAFLKNHHKLCKDKEHRQSEDDPSGEYLLEVFNQVGDFGISPEKASALVKEHYNSRCEPPWDFDNPKHASHWEEKLRNSYRYRVYTLGCCSPEVKNLEAVEDFKDAALPPPAISEFKTNQTVSAVVDAECDNIDHLSNTRRKWVVEGLAAEKFITLITAPGGTGKTNCALTLALSVRLGRDYLGPKFKVHKTGPVVVYNAEDPLDEIAKRMTALRLKHGLNREELKGIYILSGRDNKWILASVENGKVKIHAETVERIKAYLLERETLLAIFDPLVNIHYLNENSNSEMMRVMGVFAEFAELGMAVVLVHHTSKAILNDEVDTDNQGHARGAYAITGAVRFSFVLSPMRKSDSTAIGVKEEDRKSYFKLENVKANLSMSAAKAVWFQNVNQDLPCGEKVGVAVYAPLQEIKSVKEEFESGEQKKERYAGIIATLKKLMTPTDQPNFSDLWKRAIDKDCRWCLKQSTFNDELREAVSGDPEFTLIRGPRRSQLIQWRPKAQEAVS